MSNDATSHANLRRELLFAYLSAAAKVGAWVVVCAMVYRFLGAADLGILTVARSTIGLLAYAGVGLAPALVHRIAHSARKPAQVVEIQQGLTDAPLILPYAGSPIATPISSHQAIGPYSNGLVLMACMSMLALGAALFYCSHFVELHRLEATALTSARTISDLAWALAIGVILRLVSDVPAAVLQTTRWLWLDYAILATGEIFWAGSVVTLGGSLSSVGVSFMGASALILLLRMIAAGFEMGRVLPDAAQVRWRELAALLGYGVLVMLGQLADFLYAPADNILINHFLGQRAVADFVPAVLIDGGLMIAVVVLAGVLLPRAALAHAAGNRHIVRRFYIRGTLASAALLGAMALATWIASPQIFLIWFGNDMPATRAILPLLLLHTVIGGSAAVGRSVLLATGHARPYAASVLIAGVGNVLLVTAMLALTNLGLLGVVVATLVVACVRCLMWMPWYVMRVVRATAAPVP